MTRVVLLCASLILVGACRSRSEPVEPPEVVEATPLEPDASKAAPLESTEDQAEATDTEATSSDTLADPSASENGAADASTEAPPSSRDLGAELQRAVGTPYDCLIDYRPSSPMTIRVDISAVVRPTGMIIEPSATGRGLSANDRRCFEQRVGDVTLGPLEGATSERVSTHIDLPYRPEVVEEYDVGPPAPKLKDVVEPLPKKQPIPPSGVPIQGPRGQPIEGPKGVPIQGPQGVPVEGPKPVPIEGYEVDEGAERWTD